MPPARRAASLLPPGRPLYEEVRAHLTEGIAAGRGEGMRESIMQLI